MIDKIIDWIKADLKIPEKKERESFIDKLNMFKPIEEKPYVHPCATPPEVMKKFDEEKRKRREIRNSINTMTDALKPQEPENESELDREERLLDNELEYMDKMYEACKECGSDIFDVNGTCSATKCGAYKNKVYNAFNLGHTHTANGVTGGV